MVMVSSKKAGGWTCYWTGEAVWLVVEDEMR